MPDDMHSCDPRAGSVLSYCPRAAFLHMCYAALHVMLLRKGPVGYGGEAPRVRRSGCSFGTPKSTVVSRCSSPTTHATTCTQALGLKAAHYGGVIAQVIPSYLREELPPRVDALQSAWAAALYLPNLLPHRPYLYSDTCKLVAYAC